MAWKSNLLETPKERRSIRSSRREARNGFTPLEDHIAISSDSSKNIEASYWSQPLWNPEVEAEVAEERLEMDLLLGKIQDSRNRLREEQEGPPKDTTTQDPSSGYFKASRDVTKLCCTLPLSHSPKHSLVERLPPRQTRFNRLPASFIVSTSSTSASSPSSSSCPIIALLRLPSHLPT
ncbi:hypothetical protein E2C01_090840 [Portunus trituberculatus]|uniref:Uncharacterized protein n=1 Tax=Portunus trituberculatus TaxID=210409 RepID=A0A5B7JCG0_PORTR|nr:hypothetical protein [Portunus trituberculatus]